MVRGELPGRRVARTLVVGAVVAIVLATPPPGPAVASPDPVVLRIGDPSGDVRVGAVAERAGRSIDIRRVRIRIVRGDRVKVTVRINEVRSFRRLDQQVELTMSPVGRGESTTILATAGGPVRVASRPVGWVCDGGRAWSDAAADTLNLMVPRECWAVDRRGRARLIVSTGLVRPDYHYRASDGIDWTRGLRLR